MELQDDCLTPTVLVGIVEDPPLCLLNLCHLIMNAQPLSCAHHSISSPFRWSFILLLCARVFLSCTHCTRVRTHTCILLLLLSLSCTRVRTAFVQGVRCLRAFALVCCVACCVGLDGNGSRSRCLCYCVASVLRLLLCWRVSVLPYGTYGIWSRKRRRRIHVCSLTHLAIRRRKMGGKAHRRARPGYPYTHTHTHTHTHTTRTQHTHTPIC
jgi:hypothetical protein